jgi:hypothetical protein
VHVMVVLDAMKKRGHFKDYDRAQKAYEEAEKVAELAEAGLALLKGTSAGTTSKRKEKVLTKAKEAAKEALAKAQETKPETKDAEETPGVTDDLMKAGFQADLEKAKQAQETAQGAMTAATNLMFTFYSNFLSPKSKYSWNKIIVEQMEGNPYVNLQGVSLEGPRGVSHESFNDCVMFYLLTAFPINSAEQEKYYISNILNSLTPKSVPAGTKLVLFGSYILNIYVGTVQYFLRTTKLSAPKSTYRHNAQIGEYRTILTSAKKIRF